MIVVVMGVTTKTVIKVYRYNQGIILSRDHKTGQKILTKQKLLLSVSTVQFPILHYQLSSQKEL